MSSAPINQAEEDAELAAFLAAVDEGIAADDAGDVVSEEVAAEWFRARMGGENPPIP
jgi:predicted transcriptional regulator